MDQSLMQIHEGISVLKSGGPDITFYNKDGTIISIRVREKSFAYIDKDTNKKSEWQRVKKGTKEEAFYRYSKRHLEIENAPVCLIE